MQRQWVKVAVAFVGVVIVGASVLWASRWLWPGAANNRPKLVEARPLAPVTRSSRIVVPAVVSLTAIRDAMERAPRELSGKPNLPSGPYGSSLEMNWLVNRGGFDVSADRDGLKLATTLDGSLRISGAGLPSFSGPLGFPGPPPGFGPPGAFRGPPGFSGPPGNQPQQSERSSEQRAALRGDVVRTARPTLLPDWRLQPNLRSQITVDDASITVMGSKLSLSAQIKPLLERAVNEQVSQWQSRLANDPSIEQEARREWAKMCRSNSLGAAPGKPNLWLELRPTRAFAAQPGIDSSAVTLAFGVEAETRIVPSETRPDCPFPPRLELVPQMERGQVNIAVPVDVPFTEISRLLETQLKGKTFPEDRSGSFTATILGVEVAASGDRLLISLRVKANETRSWFGLGGEALIHVWGRPTLDRNRQTVRMSDIAVDIGSQTAFGLLGLAGRAAAPYLEHTLADNSTIEVLPLAANARRGVETAIAEFQRSAGNGVRIDAAVTDVRLVGLEFDSTTLRVIAEADGTVRVAVNALPAQ
jgi:hypothetical protein